MPRSDARYRANRYVSLYAPAGNSVVPLGPKCAMLHVARKFQINTLAVALGASLFQRVASADASPCTYTDVVRAGMDRFICDRPGHRTQPLVFECVLLDGAAGGDEWPVVMLACCLHLAVKLTHVPTNVPWQLGGHYKLRAVLRNLLGFSPTITTLESMEAWILFTLKYHLVDGTKQLQRKLDEDLAAMRKRCHTHTPCADSPVTVLYCHETLSPTPSP